MKTGFLIVNYNDYNSTKKLIDNIIDYKCIDKILVVDNKSTDDSYKKLRAIKNSKVEIFRTNSNNGYSYAINEGCKKLKEDLGECNIIISNSDIIINNESDLVTMLKYLDKKDVGVVAPTIMEHGNLNRGWKLIGPWMEVLMNIVGIHRIIRKKFMYYPDSHYKKDISYVDVVSGCFFMMKSDIITKMNYFDDNVFLYYEENILNKKLEKIKKKMIVVNNTLVIHNHSVSIDRSVKRIGKYKAQKNSQYYFEKNYNGAGIINLFFLKLTYFLSLIILSIYYFISSLIK